MAAPVRTVKSQQTIDHNRAKRMADYEQARALRQQGWTIPAIATHMSRDRRTVSRYLQVATFPERQPRRQLSPTVLDPFRPSLLERWNAGCHNAAQLCREIQSQGFRGQYSIVSEYVSRLRVAQGLAFKHRDPESTVTLIEAPKPLTPRGATWLVMRQVATLEEKEKRQLIQLQEQGGEIGEAITLAHDFAAIVRQHHPDKLDT